MPRSIDVIARLPLPPAGSRATSLRLAVLNTAAISSPSRRSPSHVNSVERSSQRPARLRLADVRMKRLSMAHCRFAAQSPSQRLNSGIGASHSRHGPGVLSVLSCCLFVQRCWPLDDSDRGVAVYAVPLMPYAEAMLLRAIIHDGSRA